MLTVVHSKTWEEHEMRVSSYCYLLNLRKISPIFSVMWGRGVCDACRSYGKQLAVRRWQECNQKKTSPEFLSLNSCLPTFNANCCAFKEVRSARDASRGTVCDNEMEKATLNFRSAQRILFVSGGDRIQLNSKSIYLQPNPKYQSLY